MTVESYAERMEAARRRFAATLNARLTAVEDALPHLAGTGPDVAAAVTAAHRHMHLLCGLAPTVGFSRIGRAARRIERILLDPFRTGRGLTTQEMDELKRSLATLRAETQIELSAASPDRQAAQGAENRGREAMRILVVDDSEDWQDIIKAALADAGYKNVHAVGSAERAFAELRLDTLSADRSLPYDLIVLDVVMPHTNGIDACTRIRNHPNFADVPIVMLTAIDDVDSLANAFAAGASDYVTKPFNRVELIARVRSALKTKRELDRRRARAPAAPAGADRPGGEGGPLPWIDARTGFFVGEVAEAYLRTSNTQRREQHISVLALAIDGRATIEAELGEEACDRLLIRVAEEIRGVAANVGTIAASYLDGVIVLVAPRLLSEQVRHFGEAVRGAVARAAIAKARSRRTETITVSVGAITARVGQAVEGQLIEGARSVLSTASGDGGNRVLTLDLSCT